MVARNAICKNELGERDTFQQDFRMKRDTFNRLLHILRPHISGDATMNFLRQAVDAETRLAVTLSCKSRN